MFHFDILLENITEIVGVWIVTTYEYYFIKHEFKFIHLPMKHIYQYLRRNIYCYFNNMNIGSNIKRHIFIKEKILVISTSARATAYASFGLFLQTIREEPLSLLIFPAQNLPAF